MPQTRHYWYKEAAGIDCSVFTTHFQTQSGSLLVLRRQLVAIEGQAMMEHMIWLSKSVKQLGGTVPTKTSCPYKSLLPRFLLQEKVIQVKQIKLISTVRYNPRCRVQKRVCHAWIEGAVGILHCWWFWSSQMLQWHKGFGRWENGTGAIIIVVIMSVSWLAHERATYSTSVACCQYS